MDPKLFVYNGKEVYCLPLYTLNQDGICILKLTNDNKIKCNKHGWERCNLQLYKNKKGIKWLNQEWWFPDKTSKCRTVFLSDKN